MSGGPKFTPAQREANLLTVSDLYLRGKTQADIGKQLGCSQQQVSGYLQTLYTRWEAAAAVNIDRLKALELARIDKLEAQYQAGYERSQADRGTPEEPVQRDGDLRWLDGVLKCIAMRCKIIGIEAPTKQDITAKIETIQAYDYGAAVAPILPRVESHDEITETAP